MWKNRDKNSFKPNEISPSGNRFSPLRLETKTFGWTWYVMQDLLSHKIPICFHKKYKTQSEFAIKCNQILKIFIRINLSSPLCMSLSWKTSYRVSEIPAWVLQQLSFRGTNALFSYSSDFDHITPLERLTLYRKKIFYLTKEFKNSKLVLILRKNWVVEFSMKLNN